MDFEKEELESQHISGDQKSDLPECDQALQVMLKRIANSHDAFFKSQQRGDPDLEEEEKLKICLDLLTKSVPTFLSRYGKFLTAEDLAYFKEMRTNYEIKFYLDEIEKRLSVGNEKKVVKNRRFQALQKLSKDQNYFSDAEMEKRNPLLYEQMVGRFLTDEERDDIANQKRKDCTLSSMFINQLVKEETLELYEKQSDFENSMMEEDEEEGDDDEDAEMMDPKEISIEQKQLFHEEFISLMKQSFIDGKDQDFDYSNVDFNEEYDSIQTTQQDAEDRYFDSQEPA